MRTITVSNDKTRAYAIQLLNQLAFDKHPWDIVIKRHQKQRTQKQNGLYWEWLTIIGNEIGYDKDDMHDLMREKFLPWHEVDVWGIKRKVLTSTSDPDFTTAMMTEYMNHIDRFAATELGIRLPHPEDKHYEELQRFAR